MLDQPHVLLISECLMLINFLVIFNSSLLCEAGIQLRLGISEYICGIRNLYFSEDFFGLTFSKFRIIDFIMLYLFIVNSISELIENVDNGI